MTTYVSQVRMVLLLSNAGHPSVRIKSHPSCSSSLFRYICNNRKTTYNSCDRRRFPQHVFATIANTFWNKVFITKYTKELKVQTSYGVSLIQQIETLPIIFVCAAFNNEGGAYMAYTPLPLEAKLTILATCAGGVLIGIAYPKCFSLLSGTSVVVASTANKAVSILIGMYLFGTRLSGTQVLGLAICISGSLWYALEGKRK